jgi:hypothetical protein
MSDATPVLDDWRMRGGPVIQKSRLRARFIFHEIWLTTRPEKTRRSVDDDYRGHR